MVDQACWRKLEEIVYRQDIEIKYQDLRAARLHHLKQVATYDVQQAPPKPKTLTDLLFRNAMSHFAVVQKQYHTFSVRTVDGISPLFFVDFDSAMMGLPAPAAMESIEDEVEIEPKRRKLQRSDSEEELARDDSELCFRVLSTSAGRIKHIGNFVRSSGAARLASSDIAITLHPTLAEPAEDRLVIGLKPKSGKGSGVQIVCGFDGYMSIEELQTGCMGWSEPDRVAKYGFPDMGGAGGVEREEIHTAITGIYKARAFPETDSYFPGGDPQLEPWRWMLDRGYISHSRQPGPQPAGGQPDGYQLSEEGRRVVQVGMSMRTKAPVFKVREHLQLADRTPFELAITLRDRGFEWSPFPTVKAQRLKLMHHIDSDEPADRKWYTVGAALVPSYLLCLLQGPRLFELHGLTEFPHYSKDPIKDFKAVLDQGVVFEVEQLQPAAAPKLHMAIDDGAIPADDPIQDENVAVEADHALEDLHGDFSGEEGTTENMEDFLAREIELYLAELEKGDVEEEVEDEVQELGEDVSDQDYPDGGTLYPPTPRGDGSPPDRNPGGEEAPPQQQRQQLPKIQWGCCFTIVRRTRKTDSGIGVAYEARCPFHRKNATTGCKKTFVVEPDATPDDIALITNALKWWCNVALDWRTQRDHRKSMETPFDVPLFEEAVLVGGQIPGPKPKKEDVRTDVAILRAMATEAAEAAGAVRARARGRGQGRAQGGRARGGARGRGRGAPAPPSPADAESSSSPSSSSD